MTDGGDVLKRTGTHCSLTDDPVTAAESYLHVVADYDRANSNGDGGDAVAGDDECCSIGGFMFEELLGTGAYARVMIGRDPVTWDAVAVKEISKVPAFAESFQHEFTMTRRAAHPNVITALDCIEDQNGSYIIYELATGGDLFDRLERAKDVPLSRRVCRRYLFEVATALLHCHQNGIVHGDVKLENMLLDNEDNVQLCDFGLAGFDGERRTGRPYGTTAYMAPELVSIRTRFAEYRLSPAQDVWSMGIVMYAVLFNDLPWERALIADADYCKVVSHGGVMDGGGHFDMLSPGLRTLLAGMLAHDPAERVGMAELVEFLSEPCVWFASDEVQQEPVSVVAPIAGDWRKSSSLIPGEEDSTPKKWHTFRTTGPVHLSRSQGSRSRSSSMPPQPRAELVHAARLRSTTFCVPENSG